MRKKAVSCLSAKWFYKTLKKGLDQWFSKFFLTETLSIPLLQKSQKTIAKISHYLDMVPGVF